MLRYKDVKKSSLSSRRIYVKNFDNLIHRNFSNLSHNPSCRDKFQQFCGGNFVATRMLRANYVSSSEIEKLKN